MNDAKPLIVALDFSSYDEVLKLVDLLDPTQCRVKVGKELFTRCGPEVVRGLTGRGFEVFLDLKFHDIPNTVAGACRAAADLGCWMVNVHASGGRAMLEAAREAIGSGNDAPHLIAVTVLTSVDGPALTLLLAITGHSRATRFIDHRQSSTGIIGSGYWTADYQIACTIAERCLWRCDPALISTFCSNRANPRCHQEKLFPDLSA